MTAKSLRELKREVEKIREARESGPADTPGELYMQMLEDFHSGHPNHPKAPEKYRRMYLNQRRNDT
jgi:hypothetical protein